MNDVISILRRFVSATIVICILLITINFSLLGAWFFKGKDKGNSPQVVIKSVTNGLNMDNNAYSLDTTSEKLLNQLNAWAMLLDNNGNIKWHYDLPTELPLTYSLIDVAQFSRNYLMDYPVFLWEHEDGLIVVGYPKKSLAKYHFNFPIEWVSRLPFRSIALIIGNIALALLLSILVGSQLIKSIKPLISGIHALSDEQPVHIKTKGVLKDLAKNINRTSSLLQEKNKSLKLRDEARSNWIIGISHDIRTPLSMILGYSSEIEENTLVNIESRKHASIIRQQAVKLRSLVNDLNLVSMLEYEMQPLNMEIIGLSTLAREVASEFLSNGLDEKFTIELNLSNENLRVIGDRKLLLRAITNLVQNSISHNPTGCEILLQTVLSCDKKNCHFIVSDNGKGISQSKLSNLIKLPYSTKIEHPIHNRHGLGLPMVARIAKAHQGQLILTSDTGKGMKSDLMFLAVNQS